MTWSPWRRLCPAVSIIASIALAGCATPDIKPFATETASLGSAISGEQAATIARFETLRARGQARAPDDDRLDALKASQADYAKNAKAVDAVMAVAVDYSNTLVDLAAQGETGAAAAKSLATSLNGFASALSIALPVAEVPAWAANLAVEVSAAVTRIEAQQSLAAAMREADPAIQKIAKAIQDMYRWPGGTHALLTNGLQRVEEGLLRDEAGQYRLAFYRTLAVNKVGTGSAAMTRIDAFYGDVGHRLANQPQSGICIQAKASDANCISSDMLLSLQATTALLAGIEPQFQAYTRDIATSKSWLRQRESISVPIAAAAAEWAAAHHKLADRLSTCGGTNFLRRECGNLTFANLKLFVGRVKAIGAKGDGNGE